MTKKKQTHRRHDYHDYNDSKEKLVREMHEIEDTAEKADKYHGYHDDRRGAREDHRKRERMHKSRDTKVRGGERNQKRPHRGERVERSVETYYTTTNRSDPASIKKILTQLAVSDGDFTYQNVKTIGKNDPSVPFTIEGFKQITFSGRLPFIGNERQVKPSILDVIASRFDIALLSPNYENELTNRDMVFNEQNVTNDSNYAKVVPIRMHKSVKHNFHGLSPRYVDTNEFLYSDMANQIDRLYSYQSDAQRKALVLQDGNT